MTGDDQLAEQRERTIQSLTSFASAYSELGRFFARRHQMHTTDAAAIVEILTAEGRGRPLTPARLAERIALTTGATSILLNRLEDAGHVVRTRGHRDRRVVTLHSTPAVHETADSFFAPLSRQLHSVLGNYSRADLELVEGLVDRLRSSVRDYPDEAGPQPATGDH